MDEADLIVAVGARFDDRVTGDARRVRAARQDRAHRRRPGGDRQERAGARADRRRRPARAGRRSPRRTPRSTPTRRGSPRGGSASTAWRADACAAQPTPRRRSTRCRRSIGGDAIVTTDVGQHQMWAANRLRFDRPRRWITSGGLGTMGFGLPAAIGAQIACPDETVVCVTGEGSLLLNVQELATAAHERLPVKIVVLDNARLGMVRQQQDMFWDGRRSAVDLGATPDWPALAARVRHRRPRRATTTATLDDALADTLAEPGPALVRVASSPKPTACRCSGPGVPHGT